MGSFGSNFWYGDSVYKDDGPLVPPTSPYLHELFPKRRYNRKAFFGALRALLPRGEAWLIPDSDEQDISGVGIESGEAWGRITIDQGEKIITPSGIPSGEAWGIVRVALPMVISMSSISSHESWGLVKINLAIVIETEHGIPSGEQWGYPTVSV